MLNTERIVGGEAPEMLGLLSRQVELYGRLKTLADKQRALITAEDTQPLLKVLAHRKRLTGELMKLTERMRLQSADWRRARATLPSEERRAADDLIEEAGKRLQHLLAVDEQDARMLKLRKRRVRDELESVDAGKRALVAYKSAGASASGFYDETHDES